MKWWDHMTVLLPNKCVAFSWVQSTCWYTIVNTYKNLVRKIFPSFLCTLGGKWGFERLKNLSKFSQGHLLVDTLTNSCISPWRGPHVPQWAVRTWARTPVAGGFRRSHLFLMPKLGSLRFAQTYLSSVASGGWDGLHETMNLFFLGSTRFSQLRKLSFFRGSRQGTSRPPSDPQMTHIGTS